MATICSLLLGGGLISSADALRIYRFGGDDLPPPPEAEVEGVEYIQRSWVDPVDEELGGEVFQVDFSERTIKALRYDSDENIALTARARGEGIREGPNQAQQEAAADGDLDTVWNPAQYLCANYDPNQVGTRKCATHTDYIQPDRHTMSLDSWEMSLGGFFIIDRMRIVSGLADEAAIMKNFKILAAAGAGVGDFSNTISRYREMVEVRENTQQVRVVEFPPHERVDRIALVHGEHNREWAVHEVEIYAGGFVERSYYVSEVIEFEGDMAWGDLRWSGWQDPGAEVRIHTRTGNTADNNIYWRFTGLGEKVRVEDARTYGRLKLGEKAGTTYDLDNWTFWSAPYDLADSSGTPVASLGPRRFFQFKVDVIPDNESSGELNFLELRASRPLARGLIGEVSPTSTTVGQPSAFTYYLKPSISGGGSGFDGIEVTTSSVIYGVTALRIGEKDWPFEITPLDARGAALPGFPANRFELAFVDTKLVSRASGTPVEVDFEARVLRSGAAFEMRVFDTGQPLAVRQKVEAGDANSLIEGNTVNVTTTAKASQFLRAGIEPAVFTPNGDRVNDVAVVAYDLLEIIGAAAVTIEISDLGGRVVRELYSGDDPIGHYERSWNGTDSSGAVVPPGLYIFRIRVHTDREGVASLGLVNVAY